MPFDLNSEPDNSSLPGNIQTPNDQPPPVQTATDFGEGSLSSQEKEQRRLLELLHTDQKKMIRLFGGLPTFDTVIKNLLVSTIKVGIAEHQFRASHFADLDPDHCYVTTFTLGSDGERSLTSSQSFTELLWDCLLADTPPSFSAGGVGFFSRPDTLDEADSLFTSPVDTRILRAMEPAFYIANPTVQERVKRQFRDELAVFRSSKNGLDSLGTTTVSTVEGALAYLLSRRFQHLVDLYKIDRSPAEPLTQSGRAQQVDDDRLLGIITTHPSKAERSRLMRSPIPYVCAVMLDMGAEAPQRWPAAMVIRRTDQEALFLYSLERGLEQFGSFQQLVSHVLPVYKGQARVIRDIASELFEPVFEVAAQALLQMQSAALESLLNKPGNETLALRTYARSVEEALVLPMLSLAGPLVFRVERQIENSRPDFYKTATPLQQAHYRRLEGKVIGATYRLGDGIQPLEQFARQKARHYLQQTVHADIDPDPDKTMITLFSGKAVDSRNSRTTSLTQLMLDNVRAPQYPNAMREVLTVYLVDHQGQRIRHPATGSLITLTGPELARMATTLDVGGNYEVLLREELNKPAYKAAWRAAYLANLKFKGYEATLKGDEIYQTEVVDKTLKPPRFRKQLALWLRAIVDSPSAEDRRQVSGRRVHVYGLLLGGSVGVDEQSHGAMGGAVSIDGALIFSDQGGPVIKGTVGVYFPDSPRGEELHEFSDLSDGVAGLLQREEWRAYLQSRIASADPEEIKKLLGQHRSRPLIRGQLLPGDFLENLHRAHVNFHSAYADHRSTSNRDIRRQTALRVGMAAVEGVLDLVGLLFTPGFRLLKSAVETGYKAFRTGIPMDLNTLLRVHKLVSRRGGRPVHGVILPLRGQPAFLAVAAQQNPGDALAGLPLEEALYRRYAVTDQSMIRGISPDAQGFYRPTVTGGVTRPVYVRQPDGTLFRVHDHTRLNATEATIVDPLTGLSIRSSGVMRSTVARMPNGEWRAVGFGQGGGKRKGGTSTRPGSSTPKRRALARVSDSVRTPGNWDDEVMDLVPAIITRLPSWPQNRSLTIRDEISANHHWSVRFTPNQPESTYPLRHHPEEAATDIVLSRTSRNHYSLVLNNRVVEIPADGDCFFNAVAQGLNEGQAQQTFSIQGLRDEAADYIDQQPALAHYVTGSQGTAVQRALFDNAESLKDLLGMRAFVDFTRIVHGGPNPYRLFQPAMSYLGLYANEIGRRVLNQAPGGKLPPELLQEIGRHLSPQPPGTLNRWYAPLSASRQQSLRRFLQSVLLPPVRDRHIAELLEDEHFILSTNPIHIMLEYGVTSRELTWNYPLSDDAYVLYDAATHAHLDEDELEELLDGLTLVTSDDLEEMAEKIRNVTGQVIEDDAQLLERYIDHQSKDRTQGLYQAALRRFPELQRRADILLGSPIISWTLADRLNVSLFASWLRNPALSNERLRLIAEYANARYDEIAEDNFLDLDWMQSFDDRNVQSIVTHQAKLTQFLKFLGGAWGDVEDVDVPAVARLFRAQGQPISNARVAILFENPGLFDSIQRLPREHAPQVWNELVAPYFSDANIQRALEQPGALNSALDFALALKASLGKEDARANLIVHNLFSVGQSRAQEYLYNFDFPIGRLGHSRLDFALHLEAHLAVPDWAWQYARKGVTPESLKPFGEMKKKGPGEDKS